MCNADCLAWAKRNLAPADVRGKRVIEIGAYIVNSSLRAQVEALGPAEYVGTDMRRGPGVDLVCKAEDLPARFGRDSFDIVLATCLLEHTRHWQAVVSAMKRLCKPQGLVLVIVPAVWPFHAYPNDYWRYTVADLRHIFADFEPLQIDEDATAPSLVYAKLRKPVLFTEVDLANYPLYSIITNRRTTQIRRADFLSLRFAGLAIGFAITNALDRLVRRYRGIGTSE